MAVKTKNLVSILKGIPFECGSPLDSLQISGITYDSRKIKAGFLFVAIKGFKTDGHVFIKKAIENGCIAVIAEYEDETLEIPQIIVHDSRKAMALIALNFYAEDLQKIRLIGITGTNGKTTTTYLVQSVFNSAGMPCGRIGTINYDVGGELRDSTNTTPESTDLLQMISEMVEKGQQVCVMEVSSHGLALDRVYRFPFHSAVFLNLTHDHLDFHNTIDLYFYEKKKLFGYLIPGGVSIINCADPFGEKMCEQIIGKKLCLGRELTISDTQNSINGVSFSLNYKEKRYPVESALIGEFNIENISAAFAVGLASEIFPEKIISGIKNVQNVPGRLEKIAIPARNATAIVDYSHTPDSLQKALKTLRSTTKNKLHVVFGCGGDRDRTKRPEMGQIAEYLADQVIITSDNPRTEDANLIINDILEGIKNKNSILVEADRRKAIQMAVGLLQTGDTLLVAGKGHETYQEINGVRHPFDDREIIRELIK